MLRLTLTFGEFSVNRSSAQRRRAWNQPVHEFVNPKELIGNNEAFKVGGIRL